MTFDKKYFEENEPRFLAELFSLIRIPSISAKPSHKADMTRCAERWCELLVEAGADHARLMPSAGNPLVYAERHVSDDARTVLIYAHYDVMPAEPLELWKSNPFEPEVRDGHIFARGADDDKGQAFIQVKAFEYLVRNNLLKHNVKFIFEGEEEIGSPSLAAFLEEHKELLKCDVILVSDTSMREMIAAIPFDEEAYKQGLGVEALQGEKGYSTLERNSCRPSFDVCGIWGGYTDEGAKTVIPSKAYAKVSTRLVPHQQHEKISQLFIDYIKDVAPRSVKVEVTPLHGGEGYVCPITIPAYRAAEDGFTQAFGKRPLAVRRGGSIPIISDFERVLGVKTVLMGFGLESNTIHSPNENFPLDIFRKGMEAVAVFHQRYDELEG